MSTLKNESILCLTSSDWDEPKRMRHHIMYLLSENNRVIWVEEPISFSRLKQTPFSRFTKFRKPARPIKTGLTILTPPPAIPFLDRLTFTKNINSRLLRGWLKAKLKKLGFNPTVLWIFNPYLHRLVGEFGRNISLFHCNDTHPDAGYLQTERKLIKKVDLVISLSEQIKHERERYNRNNHVVLHGVDLHSFPEENPAVPGDLAGLPKPIIGYVGAISYFVNLELLEYTAQAHPEWSIVVIGPITKKEFPGEGYKKWQQIKLPNLHYLGAKRQPEIPGYYRWLDVAIWPSVVDEQSRACQLTSKFFEYLIMGRPVVSTDFATYKGVPPEFYKIASTREEFAAEIEKSLVEDSPERQQRRREYARQNSMQKRLEQIASLISETRSRKTRA